MSRGERLYEENQKRGYNMDSYDTSQRNTINTCCTYMIHLKPCGRVFCTLHKIIETYSDYYITEHLCEPLSPYSTVRNVSWRQEIHFHSLKSDSET